MLRDLKIAVHRRVRRIVENLHSSFWRLEKKRQNQNEKAHCDILEKNSVTAAKS